MSDHHKTWTCSARFPRAADYRSAPRADRLTIRENRPGFPAFSYSERHLQAVWYDPELRPRALETRDGQRIEVPYCGEWNLESGPDFIGARLLVQPGRRQLQGDVEIHISPRDWLAHGHQHDPAFRDVCLHVTFFPGELPAGALPPGSLEVSLQSALQATPRFSFEQIDIRAYPAGVRADVPPCSTVLADWSPDAKRHLLACAGEARLHHKAQKMEADLDASSPGQVLYRETMTALGYKHNKAAFRTLADRVPLAELREKADGDPVRAYALLLGVAGLMPGDVSPQWHPDTRHFIRRLWDHWWPWREAWDARQMTPSMWKRSNLRPANHPVRRLMAAARLFVPDTTALDRATGTEDGIATPGWAENRLRELTDVRDDFWSVRLGWDRAPDQEQTALIGRQRAGNILVNVLIPFRAASGDDLSPLLPWLETQTNLEPSSRILQQAAGYLFGPDHPPAHYRDALRRQGLLQIHEDFCLIDRSRCRDCPFPDWLAEGSVRTL